MEKLPHILYLTNANDAQEYLDQLKVERQAIEGAVAKAETKGLLKIINEVDLEFKDLFKVFNNLDYRGRIKIFHYAGHSGTESITLEAKDGATKNVSIKDFSKFMGNQYGLQLVFLNSCLSENLALSLNEEGVPVVIGTEAKIQDGDAALFAEQFYQALGSGKTIGEAYEDAEIYFRNHPNQLKGSYRKLRVNSEEVHNNEMPWLISAQNAEALNWSILPKEALKEKIPVTPPISRNVVEKKISGDLAIVSCNRRSIMLEFKGNLQLVEDLVKELTGELSLTLNKNLSKKIDQQFVSKTIKTLGETLSKETTDRLIQKLIGEIKVEIEKILDRYLGEELNEEFIKNLEKELRRLLENKFTPTCQFFFLSNQFNGQAESILRRLVRTLQNEQEDVKPIKFDDIEPVKIEYLENRDIFEAKRSFRRAFNRAFSKNNSIQSIEELAKNIDLQYPKFQYRYLPFMFKIELATDKCWNGLIEPTLKWFIQDFAKVGNDFSKRHFIFFFIIGQTKRKKKPVKKGASLLSFFKKSKPKVEETPKDIHQILDDFTKTFDFATVLPPLLQVDENDLDIWYERYEKNTDNRARLVQTLVQRIEKRTGHESPWDMSPVEAELKIIVQERQNAAFGI